MVIKSTSPDECQGITQPSENVSRLAKSFGLRGLKSFIFDPIKVTQWQGLDNRLRFPPATDCPGPLHLLAQLALGLRTGIQNTAFCLKKGMKCEITHNTIQ